MNVERHGTGIEWVVKAKGVRHGGGMKVRTGGKWEVQTRPPDDPTDEGREGEGRWKMGDGEEKANGNKWGLRNGNK